LGTFGDQILGKGRSYGVSDGTIRKRDSGFLYALHYGHCDLAIRTLPSNVSDVQINRGGSLWDKIWEEGVDRCKPNFNSTRERDGAVVREGNRADVFYRLSRMHERLRQTDRQTNRPRNSNTDRIKNRYKIQTKILHKNYVKHKRTECYFVHVELSIISRCKR